MTTGPPRLPAPGVPRMSRGDVAVDVGLTVKVGVMDAVGVGVRVAPGVLTGPTDVEVGGGVGVAARLAGERLRQEKLKKAERITTTANRRCVCKSPSSRLGDSPRADVC